MKTLDMKTYEVGLVLLVHAQSAEDVRQTLEACIPWDIRLESREVQYCEENIARVICN